MILKPKNATVAYRCPNCGGVTKSVVGVFTLSGDMIKLKCPCGHSELKLNYTSERKLRLSVPCFACGKNHEFVLGENIVFNRDIILLPCAYTGLDICFIGTPGKVSAAITEADAELEKLLKESGAEDYFDGDDDDEDDGKLPDFSALPGISTVVKELLADGEITCGCEEKSDRFASHADKNNLLMLSGDYESNCKGDIELVLDGNDFVLRCLSCGAEYVIDESQYESLAERDHIDLR